VEGNIMTVRKNMAGSLMLTPSPNTSITDLTPHLSVIHAAACTVHPNLLPPRLNEKWYKLAVHGIPTDYYEDTAEGMQKLQQEIETNHKVRLTQPPRYISHPDKRVGKTASSVMIALKSSEEYNLLKRTKVTVLFEQRKVTEFFTARSIDQCRRCQKFGHHHAICPADNGPACAICAAPHPTEYHQCSQCPTIQGRKCQHTLYKCANCVAAGHTDVHHAAYSTRCPVKVNVVREAWQKTRPETTPLDAIPSEINPIADTTMTADE
jgi:hypothetical protein